MTCPLSDFPILRASSCTVGSAVVAHPREVVPYLLSAFNSRSRHHRAKRAGTRHLVLAAQAHREALHQPPLGGRDLPRASRHGGRLVGMRCRRLRRDGFSPWSLVVDEGINGSIIVVVIIVIHFS